MYKIETTKEGYNLSYETTFNQGTGYYVNMSPYVVYVLGQLRKGEKDGVWLQLSLLDLKAKDIKMEEYDNGELIGQKLFYIQKKTDRSSRKIEFSVDQHYENGTKYYMGFYLDGTPQLQGMIYEGRKSGWWIYVNGDFANATKIILQLYENNKPIKKKRMLYMLTKD